MSSILLCTYPEAACILVASIIDANLPLRHATVYGTTATLDVVVALLAVYPEAALVRNNAGTGSLPNLSPYYY